MTPASALALALALALTLALALALTLARARARCAAFRGRVVRVRRCHAPACHVDVAARRCPRRLRGARTQSAMKVPHDALPAGPKNFEPSRKH